MVICYSFTKIFTCLYGAKLNERFSMNLEEILHLSIHQFYPLKMFCSTCKIINVMHIRMPLRRGKKRI